MDLKDTYDRIASDWHADHQDDDWWAGGIDSFTSFLRPGDSVLDVGCGGGMKSRYFIKKGLRVVGIDFSEQMIGIAKKEVPNGEFHVLDLREAATLGRMFDAVFMQAVLLHIPRIDAGSVIMDMAKLVNPGGYLYIAVKDKKSGKPDEEIKQEHEYGYPYERFFSYFTLDEIKAFLKESGCSIVFEKLTPAGNTHWIEVVGKK